MPSPTEYLSIPILCTQSNRFSSYARAGGEARVYDVHHFSQADIFLLVHQPQWHPLPNPLLQTPPRGRPVFVLLSGFGRPAPWPARSPAIAAAAAAASPAASSAAIRVAVPGGRAHKGKVGVDGLVKQLCVVCAGNRLASFGERRVLY
jgi:hypothetical protein